MYDSPTLPLRLRGISIKEWNGVVLTPPQWLSSWVNVGWWMIDGMHQCALLNVDSFPERVLMGARREHCAVDSCHTVCMSFVFRLWGVIRSGVHAHIVRCSLLRSYLDRSVVSCHHRIIQAQFCVMQDVPVDVFCWPLQFRAQFIKVLTDLSRIVPVSSFWTQSVVPFMWHCGRQSWCAASTCSLLSSARPSFSCWGLVYLSFSPPPTSLLLSHLPRVVCRARQW